MKLRTGDPWMPAPAYSKTLSGLGLNLLVRDVPRATVFARDVLGAEVVYEDTDFAVYRAQGSEWMVHADHTYEPGHPFRDDADAAGRRGAGAELRVHGRSPDQAEAAARRLGFLVLAPAVDKPHGLREAYLVDGDGYVWVPDVLRT